METLINPNQIGNRPKILNVVQTGTLTRDGAIYSGFSQSNYLQLGDKVNGGYVSLDNNAKDFDNFFSTADNWEINGNCKFSNLSSTQYQVLLGANNDNGIYISTDYNKLTFQAKINGSWVYVSNTYEMNTNTKYYFKLIYDGTKYNVYINTDGQTWNNTTLINTYTGNNITDNDYYFLGRTYNNSSPFPIIYCETNLTDWSIKKNGEYWWKGVETL